MICRRLRSVRPSLRSPAHEPNMCRIGIDRRTTLYRTFGRAYPLRVGRRHSLAVAGCRRCGRADEGYGLRLLHPADVLGKAFDTPRIELTREREIRAPRAGLARRARTGGY